MKTTKDQPDDTKTPAEERRPLSAYEVRNLEQRATGAIALLRGAFNNDGAEGESVHVVCDELERLRAEVTRLRAVQDAARAWLRAPALTRDAMIPTLIAAAGVAPSAALAGPDRRNEGEWIVFILKDGGQLDKLVAAYEDEGNARDFFSRASERWTDAYLCRVVIGPPDGHYTKAHATPSEAPPPTARAGGFASLSFKMPGKTPFVVNVGDDVSFSGRTSDTADPFCGRTDNLTDRDRRYAAEVRDELYNYLRDVLPALAEKVKDANGGLDEIVAIVAADRAELLDEHRGQLGLRNDEEWLERWGAEDPVVAARWERKAAHHDPLLLDLRAAAAQAEGETAAASTLREAAAEKRRQIERHARTKKPR